MSTETESFYLQNHKYLSIKVMTFLIIMTKLI
jgi:hypothetical protein